MAGVDDFTTTQVVTLWNLSVTLPISGASRSNCAMLRRSTLVFVFTLYGYFGVIYSVNAEQYECVIEAEVQNWKGQGTGTYLKTRDWTRASDGYNLDSYTFTISDDGKSGRVQRKGDSFDSDNMMPKRFSVTKTEHARVFVNHIVTYVIAALPRVTTFSVIEHDGTSGYAGFGSCTRSK